MQPGQRAALALRPEDLRLAALPDPSLNNLAGRVVRVNYLGATLHVVVDVGGLALALTLPRGAYQVAEGQNATVCWAPSAGIMLPEAG